MLRLANGEAKYFLQMGWTAFSDLPVVPIGRMPATTFFVAREATQSITLQG